MQPRTFAMVLAAALAGLSPAAAQDDAAVAQPEATEEGEAATDAEPDKPKPGEPYLAEEHGDWELRCVAVESGPEPCQLYQVLTDQAGGAVAEMVVFPLPPGETATAGVVVTTPLETLLTESVVIAVDDNNARVYPFMFCAEQGCVSRLGLTEEEVGQFRRGNVARVRIVPARTPDQEVILTASLTGFTAGFAAIAARTQN